MSTARLTFLIVSVWLVVVIGLIWAIMGVARSADMNDCKAYATRGSAAALRELLEFPFIDVAAGKFLYRKAYTFCVNADEIPAMTFTPEEQPIVDGEVTLPPAKPAGSVPATGAEPESSEKVEIFSEKKISADMKKAWAKCAKSHPRGWDAKTHTITRRVGKKWVRVPCP